MCSIAFTPLIISYTIEILPYHLRAKAFNLFNFVISLALIFNQYVNPIALDHLGWKYYVRFLNRFAVFKLIDTQRTLRSSMSAGLLLRLSSCISLLLRRRTGHSRRLLLCSTAKMPWNKSQDRQLTLFSPMAQGLRVRRSWARAVLIPRRRNLGPEHLELLLYPYRLGVFLCIPIYADTNLDR